MSHNLLLSVRLAAFGLALLALARSGASAAATQGTFALHAGQPKIVARLSAIRTGSDLIYSFDIVQRRPGSAALLRDYVVDYDKQLHLIAISDDFKTFLHLHPALDADGHFRGTFRLPRAAHYLAYVDSNPRGFGQQVFRFPVTVGNAAAARPQLGEPRTLSDAGPYRVTINTARFRAGRETIVRVHLSKNGEPANDLHGYLGGAAHAVLIDAQTLAYAHVHPTIGPEGAMPGMVMTGGNSAAMNEPNPISDTGRVPPDYTLHVGPQPAGRYELWLQFRGGSALYVAPFPIHVR